MKAYTDLEQSKKLAEILPIESADMWWSKNFIYYNPTAAIGISAEYSNVYTYKFGEDDIPCWSLAALLDVLPPYLFEFERGIDLNVYPNLNGKGWHCSYMPNAIENMKNDKFKQITNGDNLIDAAFEMIYKLKESNLL